MSIPLRSLAEAYVSTLPASKDAVEEIARASDVLNAVRELRAFLADTSASRDDRKNALTIALPSAAKETVHVLLMLGEAGEARELERFSLHVRRAAEALRNTGYAHITSAVPMNSGEKKRLEQILRDKLKCDIHVRYDVDEHLLGGFRMTVSEREFDASVRGRIRRLRTHLQNA